MIHETAIVEDGAQLGEGTRIWHFAHVRKGVARIGKNGNIGKDVYIDTNVVIGDNCKIQNFASLYHGLIVGNDVFIGPHVCFTNDLFPRASIWNEERLVKTVVKDKDRLYKILDILHSGNLGREPLLCNTRHPLGQLSRGPCINNSQSCEGLPNSIGNLCRIKLPKAAFALPNALHHPMHPIYILCRNDISIHAEDN